MSSGAGLDDQAPAGAAKPIVFVSDPTAEAETIAQALRACGATVIEVPLSMLVARAAVQQPRVVLVDADSHGALDVVARMRELPHADDVHVVFVAAPGGALSTLQDARAHEGSALFLRPVDVPALIRDVDTLSGGRPDQAAAPQASTPPPSIAVSTPRRTSSAPSLPPPSIRSASFPSAGSEVTGSTEPGLRSARSPAPPTIGAAPPVSAELLQLLAEAEARMTIAADLAHRDAAPSPEQELESVLPEELLAALDEPLEEDDETDAPPAARSTHGPRFARERTSDGGLSRTTGASTGGATPRGGSRPSAGDYGATPPLSDAPSQGTATGPLSGSPRPVGSGSPASIEPSWIASALGDTVSVLARAVASRTSGSLCLVSGAVERRVVLREGDVVTCASSAEEESLIAFLGARGDLPRETVRRLAPKFAPFGRHAGAALVARGYLLQDQMWPTLRAHAEWVLGHIIQSADARAVFEAQPSGRLAAEPSVFGGSTGAEVFVEVIRRTVPPAAALERLGSTASRLAPGAAADLLDECVLSPAELESVRHGAGRAVGEILEEGQDGDFASALFALAQLGVVDVLAAAGGPEQAGEPTADPSALDAAAFRERVRARLELVEEGDYFAILGVPRNATGYELRRAFLELRRAFDPSRLPSPDLGDLLDDVRTIISVLEEAYEVLKDAARRERYRRAIEVAPE